MGSNLYLRFFSLSLQTHASKSVCASLYVLVVGPKSKTDCAWQAYRTYITALKLHAAIGERAEKTLQVVREQQASRFALTCARMYSCLVRSTAALVAVGTTPYRAALF